MRAMTPAPSTAAESDPNVTVTETAVPNQSASSEHGESSVSSVNGNAATSMRRKARWSTSWNLAQSMVSV